MGKATVTENMGEGKYKVKIDKAIGKMTEDVDKKQTALNRIINVLIPEAETKVQTANSEYEVEKNTFLILVTELRNAMETGSAEEKAEAQTALRAQTQTLLEKQAAKDTALTNLRTLNLQSLAAEKEITTLRELITEADNDIREVWAVDYTTTLAVGASVGTVEINGEAGKRPVVAATGLPDPAIPEKIQIVAGGADGVGIVTPKPVMTEKEWYTSETFKPGWQKWKPTFRVATITSINYAQNSCNLALADIKSTVVKTKATYDELGQLVTPDEGFDINQTATLEGVHFEYMTCNVTAFAVGDRVVVEFIGQDWNNPVVKGFVEAPRACHMQVKIRMKKAEAKQDFIDFCLTRQTKWETFNSLLNQFYSPSNGGSGVIVDIMNWHDSMIGKWRTALYGVQSE